MTIKIVTDSTCDLPPQIIESLNITVVPMYINIGQESYLDGIDISRQSFYQNLPDYAPFPTTGAPGIDTFINTYRKLIEQGATAIISIHISQSLSAVVDIARQAASAIQKVPVKVIDSLQLSLGTGFQAEWAAKMAIAGESLNDILMGIHSLASRTFVAAKLDTMEFLRRSGRMNALMTGLGSLLQMKPILTMENGKPDSILVRTTPKAEARLFKLLEKRTPIERFALLHTHAGDMATAFAEKVKAKFPGMSFHSVDITPVIGAHIGPGAVGFAAVTAKNTPRKDR